MLRCVPLMPARRHTHTNAHITLKFAPGRHAGYVLVRVGYMCVRALCGAIFPSIHTFGTIESCHSARTKILTMTRGGGVEWTSHIILVCVCLLAQWISCSLSGGGDLVHCYFLCANKRNHQFRYDGWHYSEQLILYSGDGARIGL